MEVRFVLGPAGSGKTFRCLQQIRAALQAQPDGRTLLFLAPKQATFQLERQLLSDPGLEGYSRLQILSFDRLAWFILEQCRQPAVRLLNAEGRLMVFQALLKENQNQLKTFRACASRPGFAQALSEAFREFAQYRLSRADLSELASRFRGTGSLSDKLHDLLLLLDAYTVWLKQNQLSDPDALLDIAAGHLRAISSGNQAAQETSFPPLEGLWLDGFAQMTPQEVDLLVALLPFSQHALLAFNLPADFARNDPFLSRCGLVLKTYGAIYDRLRQLDCRVEVDRLPRGGPLTRFSHNPILAHLEKAWSDPTPAETSSKPAKSSHRWTTGELFPQFQPRVPPTDPGPVLEVCFCPDREAEAVAAAREILRFVRAGGRYRDATVLVRNLEPYHFALRRVFTRYGIPFFLDRRQPVTHHPLVVLTRGAFRCAALGWEGEDWFALLKTGLLGADTDEIDRLETEALAKGWTGTIWIKETSASQSPAFQEATRRLEQRILPAFRAFHARLRGGSDPISGVTLARSIVELWSNLKVRQTLEEWLVHQETSHATVWDQMQAWVENLALAFGARSFALREWIPILETALTQLTIGVVPPALDQVLIGAIDRSRTPEVKLACLLGFNETVFPALPSVAGVLTVRERSSLAEKKCPLRPDLFEQLGHERYYGYIACTRAREKLLITFAAQDGEGRPLNPSAFIADLKTIFPRLRVQSFNASPSWPECENPADLLPVLARRRLNHSEQKHRQLAELAQLPCYSSVDFDRLLAGRFVQPGPLPATLAQKLYGPILRTSVSQIENYCACPFRFFVAGGLRIKERDLAEVHFREEGSFEHEVLARFQTTVESQKRPWRDVDPEEARELIAAISSAVAAEFSEGLFSRSPQTRFRVRALTRSLQNFAAMAVVWARQNAFDPWKAELAFGTGDNPLPAWEIDLGQGQLLHLRGKVDRIDIYREGQTAYCLVMDYKSSAFVLDSVLVKNGIRLQLPVYLAAIRHSPAVLELLAASELVPAGLFYINLHRRVKPLEQRDKIEFSGPASTAIGTSHRGWFNSEFLTRLDTRPDLKRGDQFKFKFNRDGTLNATSDGLPPAVFQANLGQAEKRLVEAAREIFAGHIAIDPYQHKKQRACRFCDYSSVCRIDPWRHPFRDLR